MPAFTSLPRSSWPQVLTIFASRVVDFYQQAAFLTAAPYLLASFAPAGSGDGPGREAALAAQVGVATGVFTAAQVVTSVYWGGAADRLGRKSVLVLGLMGTALACLGQAFAQSVAAVVFWRAVAGAVNGTVPAGRAAMSEAVDARHHPAAFSLLVLSFNVASLLGPAFSAAVMVPAERLPSRVGAGWLAQFPYALPSLLSALFVAAGALLVQCVLKETGGQHVEKASLGDTEAAQKPNLGASSSSSSSQLWTPRFIAVVASVALLDTHLGAFSSVWPLFISTGLGLPPSSLATTTSVLGFEGLVLQLFVVPALTTKHGTLRPYRLTLFLFPLSYMLIPLLGGLSFSDSFLFWPAVVVLLTMHVIARTFSLLAVLLLLNSSAGPRGKVHGIGNATTGVARTLGAVAGGAVYGFGNANGMPGLAWWLSAATAGGAWIVSLFLES